MTRLVIVVAVALVAVGIAAVVRRRRPDAPTSGSAHVPMQVDRRDFARSGEPWALLVFTSATCATCADVWREAVGLDRPGLACEQVEAIEAKQVHERYGVDAVPLAILVDADGVTRRWFLGPVRRGEIASAVAETIR